MREKMNALTEAALLKAVDSGYLMIEPAPPTGKLVAVVGAGASGVACAHRLAMLGNDVLLFEARSRERMLQSPPVLDAPEQEEFERLLACGRIRCEYGRKLGENLDLADLYLRHDAVYLGVGLAMARVLGLSGVAAAGLVGAGRQVAAVYADEDLPMFSAPQRAIVIGASHGALATALRLKALGAQDVTLALRHALAPDGAEIQAAREHFVRVRTWVAPMEVLRGEGGALEAVRFEQTRMLGGCVVTTGGFTELAAQAVFKAVGRAALTPDPALRRLAREGDRIEVDANFRSALPGIYAGGDCVAPRLEPHEALHHGERAAQAIHADLQA
jgi:dihydropyrimidine dehydrogenase (NAD+) subunit PreT